MVDWSTSGPLRQVFGGLDWSSSGPEAPASSQKEWFPVPGRLGRDRLEMIDRSISSPTISGAERMGIIERAGVEIQSALTATEILAVRDRIGLSLAEVQREILGAMDRAAIGVPTKEKLVAIDRASIPNLYLPGNERLTLADRVSSASLYLPGHEHGISVDRAVAQFAYASPVTVEVTATGTVTIPPWFRYIDVVGVSAGGGGGSGNQALADGRAGTPGNWIAQTWDRGIGRNSWLTISVTIGAPGVGGARNITAPGTAAGDTTIAIPAAGLLLTATGGLGGSGTNPIGQTLYLGPGPGNQIWQSVPYTGGPQAAKSQPGGFPGGAGAGGSGSVWPGNGQPGGLGGAGKVWIRFWMD